MANAFKIEWVVRHQMNQKKKVDYNAVTLLQTNNCHKEQNHEQNYNLRGKDPKKDAE